MCRQVVRVLIVFASLTVLGALSMGRTAADDPVGTTGGTISNDLAHETGVQSPDFVALKTSYRLGRDATSGAPVVLPVSGSGIAAAATNLDLSTAWTKYVVEPEGRYSRDDNKTPYTDEDYWNFCAPGATTVLYHYWFPDSLKQGNFTVPYGPGTGDPNHGQGWYPTTHWEISDTGTSDDTLDGYATHGRAWVMYFATKVFPNLGSHQWADAGEDSFDYYPTKGAALIDVRDALNWEVSGYASNWYNYWWNTADPADADTLHDDVVSDLSEGVAVYAAVVPWFQMADGTIYKLQNWTHDLNGSGHAIAITGVSDADGTYTYIDTCGANCNPSSTNDSVHVWHVSQYALWKLIHVYQNGGIVW